MPAWAPACRTWQCSSADRVNKHGESGLLWVSGRSPKTLSYWTMGRLFSYEGDAERNGRRCCPPAPRQLPEFPGTQDGSLVSAGRALPCSSKLVLAQRPRECGLTSFGSGRPRSRAGREHWGQGHFSRSWAGLQSPRHLRVQWAPPFQPNAGPVGTSSVRRVQEGPASDPGSPHLWPTGASCPEKTSGAAPSCRTAAPAAATRGAQGPRLTLRSSQHVRVAGVP